MSVTTLQLESALSKLFQGEPALACVGEDGGMRKTLTRIEQAVQTREAHSLGVYHLTEPAGQNFWLRVSELLLRPHVDQICSR